MPVNGMTLAVGATSAAVTGGTSKTFSSDGMQVTNGIHLIDTASTDFRTTLQITLRNKAAASLGNGQYGKYTREGNIYYPVYDAATDQLYPNVGYFKLAIHPFMTAATKLDIALLTAQMLFDADLASFRDTGSLV